MTSLCTSVLSSGKWGEPTVKNQLSQGLLLGLKEVLDINMSHHQVLHILKDQWMNDWMNERMNESLYCPTCSCQRQTAFCHSGPRNSIPVACRLRFWVRPPGWPLMQLWSRHELNLPVLQWRHPGQRSADCDLGTACSHCCFWTAHKLRIVISF